MIKNYIKIALRTLVKNKVYTFINIFGLALGLFVSLLVFMFVKDELSYDKHFQNHENIYRVGFQVDMSGQKTDAPLSCSPMAEALRTEFTEIETATRTQPYRWDVLLAHEDTKMYIENGARVDSCFFKVFRYDFIFGDPKTALKENNAIVLTDETASIFFGDENPMGKIIKYDNTRDLIVRGVVKRPEGNGHFDYSFFIAENTGDQYWISNNYCTYFLAKSPFNPTEFRVKMQENFYQKLAPEVERFLKIPIEEFFSQNNTFEYDIQPIADIHLHSNREWEIRENGNIIYIYVFVGIALLVIVIAGINFMNLATARSSKRAKEVGIRKVTGATKGLLIKQFLIESIIQSFIALFLAFVLLELFLPAFNNVMETNLKLINNHIGQTIGFAVLITLVYGLFSGSYPAFFLSGFQPVKVLKGDMNKTKSGILLRKSLVVLQFASSIILIIGMLIIFRQINYMHKKDLGFNKEQVLIAPIQTRQLESSFDDYKNVFKQNSNVLSVARSSFFPGDTPSQNVYRVEGSEDNLSLWFMRIDYDLIETLGLTMLEGEGFDQSKHSDSISYYIINETAVKRYRLENPIGKRIGNVTDEFGGRSFGKIIGVVKDFHTEGFTQEIKPMILFLENNLWSVAFKINAENTQETVEFIEEKWSELEPSHPFRYEFLDDKFGAMFQKQLNFGKIFLYLTILAILIAAMGLYGLTAFTAEQKTKEIGIRKVLGASVPQLMMMLTSDFLKLVLVSALFAWPLTFLLAKEWLKRFSYQIEMPLLPYVLATLAAVVVAVLTTSYQAYQAANSDPVEAIKHE